MASYRSFSSLPPISNHSRFDDFVTQQTTELTEKDGILQHLDASKERYIFLHRTFQEYLTASYMKRQPDCINLAFAHINDLDWLETLSLLARMLEAPNPLLQKLQAITEDRKNTSSKNPALVRVARQISAKMEHDQRQAFELGISTEEYWAKQRRDSLRAEIDKILRRHRDHKVKEVCMIALTGRNPNNAVSYILGLVDERIYRQPWDDQVKNAALLAIEYLHLQGYVDTRPLSKLMEDANPTLRQFSVEVLQALGQVRRFLLEMLACICDQNREVSMAAGFAIALRGINDRREDVEVLIHALHHENPNVRRGATMVIPACKKNSVLAIKSLRRLLTEDPDSEVRAACDKALRSIQAQE